MKHSKLLLSPSEALLRIYAPSYLSPCRTNPSHLQTRNLQRKATPKQARQLPLDFKLPPIHPQAAARHARQTENDKLSSFTINNQISTTYIQLKSPETNKLSDPQPLQSVLETLSPNEIVHQLSPTSDHPDTAIARVTTRTDLLSQIHAKQALLKDLQKDQKQSKSKQIEINWGISTNDLDIKLKQMAEFLVGGRKVELLLANKKRQRRASVEEGEAVLRKIRGRVEELEAKEIKDMEGAVCGQAVLVLQKR